MARPAGVNQQSGRGQRLHQATHPAGMIQMHMGGDHIFHLAASDPFLFQQIKDDGDGVMGTGFDDGALAVIFHQVAGGQFITDHGRINAGNTVG